MAYFRVVNPQLARINALLNKEDSWLILINADPDALGAAMALQRILRTKTKLVHIARINEISRPDNLAMIRNLRIPVKPYHTQMLEQYTKFAIVDSQPHHSPIFANIPFSIIIDHHPLPLSHTQANALSNAQPILPTTTQGTNLAICADKNNADKNNKVKIANIIENSVNHIENQTNLIQNQKRAPRESKENSLRMQDKIPQKILPNLKEEALKQAQKLDSSQNELLEESHIMHDIRPDYGATCTMLTEYLYHANIRPTKYLATAMQYGIRTDTGMFGRHSTEVDIRAYHFLSRFADSTMLMRIIRSEYLPQWLPYFTRAFDSFKPCGMGHFTYVAEVESPDILVVIADFFLRVHGLKYIVITGIYKKRIICIFRGADVNLGLLAQKAFSEYGSAGGHSSMARAEISLADLRKIKKDLTLNLRKKKLSLEENKEIEEFLIARLKQFGTRKILKENKEKI